MIGGDQYHLFPELFPWTHGQGGAVIQGLMVIKDVQNVPLALGPGLWKISCSKQKWKNSPEELEKECVA